MRRREFLLTVGSGIACWPFAAHAQRDNGPQLRQHIEAADKIGQYLKGIEGQIGLITQLPWTSSVLAQRRFDALHLLRQNPAITVVGQLDASGKEQLRVSRLPMDALGIGTDYSKDPKFAGAMAQNVYYGPVQFGGASEPYMTLSLAGAQRDAGVTWVTLGLKVLQDVVSSTKIGDQGLVYVLDANDRVIAHAEVSLIQRDFSSLVHVQTARAAAPATGPGPITRDSNGREVLTAYTPVARPNLNWLVFAELPAKEGQTPEK